MVKIDDFAVEAVSTPHVHTHTMYLPLEYVQG